MGCIQTLDFQLLYPLTFSSIALFFYLYKIQNKEKSELKKYFYDLAQTSVVLIFFASFFPITCATPCSYPCCLYNTSKIQGLKFALVITLQFFIRGSMLLAIIEIYWNFIKTTFKKSKLRNVHEITWASNLSFCPSSALYK